MARVSRLVPTAAEVVSTTGTALVTVIDSVSAARRLTLSVAPLSSPTSTPCLASVAKPWPVKVTV